MGDFLQKLNVYKATANFKEGNEMFGNYSKVNEKFLEIRQIVIDNKKPRRLEVQGHLGRDSQSGKLVYQTFEENHEGIIKSYMTRYPDFDQDMVDLFLKYQAVNRPAL